MSDIMTVAQSTFERFARLKALYVILVICVLDVAAMGLYKDLTMGLEQELMVDAAMAIITVVGLLTAMVAAFEVPRELREKTAQFILTKPMGRSSFVWGKFFGVGLLCIFNIAIVTVGSILVYHARYDEFHSGMIYASILVAGEALILTGFGLVFSMFLTDTMAAIAVFVMFFLGHAVYMLPRMYDNSLMKAIYYVLPSFYNLDIKTEISSGIDVPSLFVQYGVIYAILYAIAMTGLATLLFSRKDVS